MKAVSIPSSTLAGNGGAGSRPLGSAFTGNSGGTGPASGSIDSGVVISESVVPNAGAASVSNTADFKT